MRNYQRRCPACGVMIRHSHTCNARSPYQPPLEGEELLAAIQRVKDALWSAKHPEDPKPAPQQDTLI